MPFDGTNFRRQGDPRPEPSSEGLVDSLKDAALAVAVVLLAFVAGGVAGAAVDGFHSLPPIETGRQPGSFIGQVAGSASFVLVIAGFLWWRVRRETTSHPSR